MATWEQRKSRTYLKIIFWPNLGVGAFFQVLDILEYACGLRPTKKNRSGGKSRTAGKLSSALILDKNLYFEIGYRKTDSPLIALPLKARI